jgi:hypothetical protein
MSENLNIYINRLIHENSPYLLQHAHNPVDWFAWGEEALEKAKSENKLILVSVGYAACHWCHVMAHESFENSEIADLMNANFVCIKVDREERPDIDKIYMNAVQLISRQGGWPLNCFCLPDAQPVWGGTYFRPEQWLQILENLTISFKTQPEKFKQAALEIKKGILNSELISRKLTNENFRFKDLQNAVEKYKNNFDTKFGGTVRAPKFPMPVSLNFLIDFAFYSKDETISEHVDLTLTEMARGGIYDQIGGGFARYSTDEKWLVPHFEKMLYDNAQLIRLYSKAFQQNPNPIYKKTVFETIEFCEHELLSQENAFYSSLDADSAGEEGLFYVWTKSEIDEILGSDSDFFCEYFGINESGNWENGKNILHISSDISKQYNIDENSISKVLENSCSKLLKIRNKKIRPALDDKILTSWNALMISAYCEAFEAFGEISFLEKAKKTSEFILHKQITKDFQLYRNYKNGKSTINGFLDDYSFTIEAFINLYQTTSNEKYLLIAKNFQDYIFTRFYDSETGMFFYTSDIDKVIVTRKFEVDDNVIPSSNSVTARNLYLLGLYFYDEKYSRTSLQMCTNIKENVYRNPGYFAGWASLSLWFSNPPFEVVIIGSDAVKFQNHLKSKFRPNTVFAISEQPSELPIFKDRFVNGKTAFYICRNHICQFPVFSISKPKIF